jgi:hypothetical protein
MIGFRTSNSLGISPYRQSVGIIQSINREIGNLENPPSATRINVTTAKFIATRPLSTTNYFAKSAKEMDKQHTATDERHAHSARRRG